MITLLNGGVLSICVVQIPQRFIAVNGMSAFSAAARLLAFGILVPAGSAVALTAVNKLRAPPSVVLALGAVFHLSGTIPLSQAPTSHHVAPWQYACQALIGIGVGCIIPIVVHMIPRVMERRDMGMYLLIIPSL
jgi:flagellar biosynthesis protein FliR